MAAAAAATAAKTGFDLAGLGAMLAGVGGLASATGSGRGGMSKKRANAQWDLQMGLMMDPLQYIVPSARRQNISPLAALGVQPVRPPAVPVAGMDRGRGLSRAGRSVMDLAAARGLRRQQDQALFESKARVKVDEMQAQKIRSDIMLDWQRYVQSMGIPDLWIKVKGSDGRIYEVINPDIADAFNEGAGLLTARKWAADRPPAPVKPVGKRGAGHRGYGGDKRRVFPYRRGKRLPDVILKSR